MSYAIQAEGLVKRFDETTALGGVDFAARTGTVLGVLGPNGAGKTTAVRILATLTQPDEGRAIVGGHDVVREAHQVRRMIGLTGQYASVDEMLTGTENLVMIGRLLDMSRSDARKRAAELLERFGLTDAADRATKTYSGGMRRRLDLAACLVGRPQILFLDEPTTGLDPRSRGDLWVTIRELVSEGVTVLLTTQYLEEADQLADDIVVVDHGVVIATGTPDDLKTRVGGQILQVKPVNPSDRETVAGLVSVVAGDGMQVEGELVTVPVTDPAVLPTIVRRLDEAGVLIAELSLRKSSLDEVFLSLTGHRVQDDKTSDADLIPEGSAL
jgi:oleandomycin transport system ATP-binding protein